VRDLSTCCWIDNLIMTSLSSGSKNLLRFTEVSVLLLYDMAQKMLLLVLDFEIIELWIDAILIVGCLYSLSWPFTTYRLLG
jgi:hypothetical protein